MDTSVEKFLSVPKYGATVQLSDEQFIIRHVLGDAPEPTAEEIAAYEAWEADRRAAIHDAEALIADLPDGPVKAVLHHHRPVRITDNNNMAECDGCDQNGMETEPAEWPCSTWTIATEGNT